MRGAVPRRYEKGRVLYFPRDTGSNPGKRDIHKHVTTRSARNTLHEAPAQHPPLPARSPFPFQLPGTPSPIHHSRRILVSGSASQGPPAWGGMIWRAVPPAGRRHTGCPPYLPSHARLPPSIPLLHHVEDSRAGKTHWFLQNVAVPRWQPKPSWRSW